MEEHISSLKHPQYLKYNECGYTNKKREAEMSHKEIHKQHIELKCKMCIYTKKNEA